MAKKKKSRQPNSKQDSDDEQSEAKCIHLCRALNQTAIKKALKTSPDFYICQPCGTPPPAGGLWLCLQCGHVGCGAEVPTHHSLHHYRTPRSDCHALATHLDSWLVWCFSCEKEVGLQSSVRLKDLVNFLKKNVVVSSIPPPSQQEPIQTNGVGPHLPEAPPESAVPPVKITAKPSLLTPKPKLESHHVPFTHVKGLENLGNTCFFNSVVQCLNQTQLLHELLESQTTPPFSWSFSNHLTAPHGDGLPVESFSVCLEGTKNLTQSLANFLQQLRAPLPKKGHQTLSPSQLFGEIVKKCSQFKDYNQQDSHELLRSLLDSLRTEQMKRQKNGLLHQFKLFKSIDPKEELTNKILKALSRQACYTLVDQIFGGHIISTVLCEECHYSSQLLESFLDISLPLFDQPAGGKETKDAPTQLSKHQMKKAKKMNRRAARQNGSTHAGKAPENAAKNDVEAKEQRNEENVNVKGNEEILENGAIEKNEEDHEELKNGEIKEDTNGVLDDKKVSEESNNIVEDIELKDGSMTMETNEVKEEIKENGEMEENGLESSFNEDTNGAESAPCEEIQVLCHRIRGVSIRSGEKCNSDLLQELKAEAGSVEEDCPSHFQKDFVYKCMTTLAPHPDIAPGYSVSSCLRRFTAPEHMSEENKFLCERCTKMKGQRGADGKLQSVYTNATLQVLLLNCPPVLTLHLKRFHQDGYALRKMEKFVSFPLLLDMAPYTTSMAVHLPHMSAVKSQILYSLYGVVEHQGRLTRGHFTAYVRSHSVPRPQQFVMKMPLDLDLLKSSLLQDTAPCGGETAHSGGRWYHVSDTSVREVTEAQVLRCQAYLLFYQRIL